MSTAAGGGMFFGKMNEWKCLRSSVQTGDCCSLLPVTTELKIPETKNYLVFLTFSRTLVKIQGFGESVSD